MVQTSWRCWRRMKGQKGSLPKSRQHARREHAQQPLQEENEEQEEIQQRQAVDDQQHSLDLEYNSNGHRWRGSHGFEQRPRTQRLQSRPQQWSQNEQHRQYLSQAYMPEPRLQQEWVPLQPETQLPQWTRQRQPRQPTVQQELQLQQNSGPPAQAQLQMRRDLRQLSMSESQYQQQMQHVYGQSSIRPHLSSASASSSLPPYAPSSPADELQRRQVEARSDVPDQVALLWCEDKNIIGESNWVAQLARHLSSSPAPTEFLRDIQQRIISFKSPVTFTRWLFEQDRGDILPWCILICGWREAKPCAQAIVAAVSGDTSGLRRPDARRGELKRPIGNHLLDGQARIAVSTVLILSTSAQEYRIRRWIQHIESGSMQSAGISFRMVTSMEGIEALLPQLILQTRGRLQEANYRAATRRGDLEAAARQGILAAAILCDESGTAGLESSFAQSQNGEGQDVEARHEVISL